MSSKVNEKIIPHNTCTESEGTGMKGEQGGTSVMNEEELKKKAKELLYESERKNVRICQVIREYEHRFYDEGDALDDVEMEDWKSKELYLIDLRNERDTVFNTIVLLGVMSQEEAANIVCNAGKEIGVNEIRTRR